MWSTLFKGKFLGLFHTWHPVWKPGEFSKSRLSGNQTFSFPDAWLLKLLKSKRTKNQKIFFNFFFQLFFSNFIAHYFFKEKKFKFDEFHWNSVIWYVKYKSGFSPVRQNLSGRFGCPFLFSQENHMPNRL